MSYLRELSRDVQVRRLRRLLPGNPPSSWRVAELLDYADASGATRSSDTTLLAQTARANALAGRDDIAIACCERGLPRDPAKFHAIAANFVHHRRGI